MVYSSYSPFYECILSYVEISDDLISTSQAIADFMATTSTDISVMRYIFMHLNRNVTSDEIKQRIGRNLHKEKTKSVRS